MKKLAKNFLKGFVFWLGFSLFFVLVGIVIYNTFLFDKISVFYTDLNKDFIKREELDNKISQLENKIVYIPWNLSYSNNLLSSWRINIKKWTANSLSTPDINLKSWTYLVYYYNCLLKSSSQDDNVQMVAESWSWEIESFFTNFSDIDTKYDTQIPFILRVKSPEASVSFKLWNPNSDMETLTNTNDSDGLCESFTYIQIN